MEISNNTLHMLELMERPGFIAAEGRILYVNSHAVQYHLKTGMALDMLLQEYTAQYESFTQGSLSLTVAIEKEKLRANIQKMDGFDLFLLEPKECSVQLHTLAMASQQLRIPMAGLINALDDNSNPQANRSAMQLHRAISNMSDAMRYRNYRQPDLQILELRSFLDSVMESVTAHTEALGILISYTGLSANLYCLIDQELLERAILNLISNSIKSHSSCIEVKLSRQKNTLYFSVLDNGKGVPPQLRGQIFSRFQREPGLYDSSCGLGLGMVIVQAAAAAHNGTVLMEHRQSGGLHITMTLSIMKGDSTVRAPLLKMDYLGGMDHTLTELSDVLPDSKYRY